MRFILSQDLMPNMQWEHQLLGIYDWCVKLESTNNTSEPE